MGFPIRKSTGRRLFAPHRSLSQRTTSFIASCRQGIHRMLLGRLIALISNAHPTSRTPTGTCGAGLRPAPSRQVNTAYRKTRLHRDRPRRSLRLASSRSPHPRAQPCCTRHGPMPCDDGGPGEVQRLGHIPSSRCQPTRRVAAADTILLDWTSDAAAADRRLRELAHLDRTRRLLSSLTWH